MEAEDERNRLRLDHSTVDVAFQNILLSMFGFRDRMEKEICLARREVGRFTCVCVCVSTVCICLPLPCLHHKYTHSLSGIFTSKLLHTHVFQLHTPST